MIEVKVKRLSDNVELPFYATKGAAGMDLRAHLAEDLTIHPLERVAVPTGIAIGLPGEAYAAFIFARSGMALKHGITLPNAVGVIDSDYTGEIKVALTNLGSEPFVIKNGDRIAQMVVMEITKAKFVPVDCLDKTERGAGGFGSTGRD